MVDQHSRERGQGGFTLLELLVVIAIFGLIMLALTGGLRFAGRAWETQERIIGRQGDLDAVQNILRQLIASGQGFEGDRGSLRFVGTLPRALALAGRFDVAIGASGDRLVLSWRPHVKSFSPDAEPSEVKLAPSVSSVSFAYYFPADSETPGWQIVSPNRDKRPDLIAISVQTADGRHWPPLTVAPMIEPPSQ